MPWVTVLQLQNNEIGDTGAIAMAASLPPSLVELDLGHNHIGDAGTQALAAQFPASLKTLVLAGNRLGDDGAFAIAGNISMLVHRLVPPPLDPGMPPALDKLDLRDNAAMTDAGRDAIRNVWSVRDGVLYLS
ncbi:hypothetical protein BC828DRAFT_108041 [Blastocladiella britannica]|nr:hypothetical protein BC828DRAFT_108041 [Blastocladiella britannica]